MRFFGGFQKAVCHFAMDVFIQVIASDIGQNKGLDVIFFIQIILRQIVKSVRIV